MRGDVLRKHPPHTPPKPLYQIDNKNPPAKAHEDFFFRGQGDFYYRFR